MRTQYGLPRIVPPLRVNRKMVLCPPIMQNRVWHPTRHPLRNGETAGPANPPRSGRAPQRIRARRDTGRQSVRRVPGGRYEGQASAADLASAEPRIVPTDEARANPVIWRVRLRRHRIDGWKKSARPTTGGQDCQVGDGAARRGRLAVTLVPSPGSRVPFRYA